MGKLTDAVLKNNVQEIQRLLEGEYKNSPLIDEETLGYEHGPSALGYAASCGFVDIIALLLKAGADINGLDKSGRTPLRQAAGSGQVRAIQALLNAGAKIDQPNKDGVTPLHEAAYCEKVEAIQALLKAGAIIDQTDESGRTPLHWAAISSYAIYGKSEAIQALLNAGANASLKTKGGQLPLDMAKERNSTAIVNLLQQHALTPLALKQKQIIDLETRLKALEAENKELAKKLGEEQAERITDKSKIQAAEQQLQQQTTLNTQQQQQTQQQTALNTQRQQQEQRQTELNTQGQQQVQRQVELDTRQTTLNTQQQQQTQQQTALNTQRQQQEQRQTELNTQGQQHVQRQAELEAKQIELQNIQNQLVEKERLLENGQETLHSGQTRFEEEKVQQQTVLNTQRQQQAQRQAELEAKQIELQNMQIQPPVEHQNLQEKQKTLNAAELQFKEATTEAQKIQQAQLTQEKERLQILVQLIHQREEEIKQKQRELKKIKKKLKTDKQSFPDWEAKYNELIARQQKLEQEKRELEQDKKNLEEHSQALTLRVCTLEAEQKTFQQKQLDLEQLRKSLQQSKNELSIKLAASKKVEQALKEAKTRVNDQTELLQCVLGTQLGDFRKYGLGLGGSAFQQLLVAIKLLIEEYKAKVPKCFISYAWEDEKTPVGKAANEQLQKWLLHLERDLGKLGINTSLDIIKLSGNMRDWMQKNIEASDFILLIGTPRLKERAAQNTNVAFELEYIRAKAEKNAKALIPLLYVGEFGEAFPDNISQFLIRDFRNPNDYPHLMVGSVKPLGIIPALYPRLENDGDYKALVAQFFESKLQKIQQEQKLESAKLSLSPAANYEPVTALAQGQPSIAIGAAPLTPLSQPTQQVQPMVTPLYQSQLAQAQTAQVQPIQQPPTPTVKTTTQKIQQN